MTRKIQELHLIASVRTSNGKQQTYHVYYFNRTIHKSNLVTEQCSKEQKPHKSITLYNLLSSVKENKSHRPSFSSHWVEEKQNSMIYACKWLACTLSPNCRIEDRLGTGKVSEK